MEIKTSLSNLQINKLTPNIGAEIICKNIFENLSSNICNEKDNSQTIKIDKEKIICKDGFCSLPGHKESSKIDKNDINLFDPI